MKELKGRTTGEIFAILVVGAVLTVAVLLLEALFAMLVWNNVVVPKFDAPTLGYGDVFLIGLLFHAYVGARR